MELFKAKTQDRFLVLAFQFHRERQIFPDNPLVIEQPANNGVIHWLYGVGRDYNVLDMDFLQFERVLLNKETRYSEGRFYTPWWQRPHRRWTRAYSHNCPPEEWRVLRGFFFNGHPKKDKTPTPQKDWRRQKKFTKDKRRRRRAPWKRDTKSFSASKHRALERQCISAGTIDMLARNSYKRAENPWSWD